MKNQVVSMKETLIGEPRRVDFGLVDERGRAVGVRVYLYEGVVGPMRSGADCSWYETDMNPGDRFFAVRVQPTRNGATYGSLQKDHQAGTKEEAEALGEKLVVATLKRYGKKYQAAGGVR